MVHLSNYATDSSLGFQSHQYIQHSYLHYSIFYIAYIASLHIILYYSPFFGTGGWSSQGCHLVWGIHSAQCSHGSHTQCLVQIKSWKNLEICSSHHVVGQAAALLAMQTLPITTNELDVSILSLVGSDAVPLEMWQAKLAQVKEMEQFGQGAQVFSASFSSVPDIEWLANWLATKWAPAVLQTYDIAAIRRGAQPACLCLADRGGTCGNCLATIGWVSSQHYGWETNHSSK